MSPRDRSPTREPKSTAFRERPQKNEEPIVTQTQLNELTAKILKAKLRKAPELPELESQYKLLEHRFYANHKHGEQVAREAQYSHIKKSFAEKGKANEDDMSVRDMLREEKLTTGLERSAIESIVKDKKYSNDLDYQDDNSAKLATSAQKSAKVLHNTDSYESKKLQLHLEKCQLCIENDNPCDLISMAEHTFLTVPSQPDLVKFSTMIVPINHVKNTIHCDEDEWEEIRNYMISLSKFYYSKLNKAVIFYENAVSRYNHAAIYAIPIPLSEVSSIQGFFRRAFIDQSSDFSNNHHDPIINTLTRSETMGRDAFRHSIAKEAPYFHVWFSLNGGLGHIIEDPYTWPRGDLFAREVIGGVLGLEGYVVKKQGYRWDRDDERVRKFSDLFKGFDWVEKLYD